MDPLRPHWVVWNVGQGLWITYVDIDQCLHFDSGGERNPIYDVYKACQKKKNILFLSHWDWDHMSFAQNLYRKFSQNLCLGLRPLGSSSRFKERILQHILKCPSLPQEMEIFSPGLSKVSNEQSHIVVYKKFLLPGDSTEKMEAQWIPALKSLSQVKILLLGHHGSKTSTSSDLLRKLPNLKMAIASSRWKRYGHPHPKTLAKLHMRHISVLRTEDWGNIWFEQ